MKSLRSHRRLIPERGSSIIEVALMSPFILLLFLAVFNFGFYVYATISTANAARAAALALTRGTSYQASQAEACLWARNEMRMFINVAPNNNCQAPPLQVTAVAAVDDAGGQVTRVRVIYQTIQLFPLPWMLGKMTFEREIEARMNPRIP